jgi:hypothetical protein
VDGVKTYATVGFIGVVTIAALVIGTRPTVMRGHVIADKLLQNLKEQGENRVERIECDDEIPIQFSGAKFECTVFGGGDSMDVEYEMARDGSLLATPLVQRRRKP